MKKHSNILSKIICLVIFSELLSGQTYNLENSYPKLIKPFQVLAPQLDHFYNRPQIRPGWAVTVKYPGFASFFGEVNFGLTTQGGNSFSFGLGDFYLVSESNFRIKKSPKGQIYINWVLGGYPGYFKDSIFQMGFIGGAGISYTSTFTSKTNLQMNIDGYFHYGMIDWVIAPDIPETRGVQVGFDLQYQVSHHLFISWIQVVSATGIDLLKST